MKGKFQPKPCGKNIKNIPTSFTSTRTASPGGIKTSVPPCKMHASDQFVSLEMLDSNMKLTSTAGADGPIFTSNLNSDESEPISVSPELEVSHSSLETSGFVANYEASQLSPSVANLQRDFTEVGKKPATIYINAEPVDDLFLQSDQPAVKQIGKFRPKPALHVKAGKKTKSVSFVLPDDGRESSAFVECKPELVASTPIERITSVVETVSHENIDGSLGPLSTCNKDKQVYRGFERQDVNDITSLETPNILSEPICNSDEIVEKFQTDVENGTKIAEAIYGSSPDLVDFGTSDLDSSHIESVATCGGASISQTDTASGCSQLDSLSIHSNSLDAHDTGFFVDGLIESLAMKVHSNFLTNSSEDRACVSNNDLVGQSIVENEDLCNVEGEQTIDHIEVPNLEEYSPNIVQNYGDEKSLRRVRQSKRKPKPSVIDSVISEDQNSKDTMSAMDDDYPGGFMDEDMPEKKKMKTSKRSSKRVSKKASGKPDPIVKDPPKKRLPHGSSRSKNAKRQVNKALLEIPDDELDRKQIAIRDLIRLAGFKERISNKVAAALKTPSGNLSKEHEQDQDDDDAIINIQGEGPRLNYHSYMTRPQQMRWSSAETELFYQAIGQFGTDFAMIQVLFPNRSRQQVKAKFKNEQRKHPLQIADAIVFRSKDHSHFEKVIKHLQAVAEQNSKNNPTDSSIKSQDEEDQNEGNGIEEADSKEK